MVDPNTRIVMSNTASFRIAGADLVETNIGGMPGRLAMDLYRLALEFAEPHTVAEVHGEMETDAAVADIANLVDAMLVSGVLRLAGKEEVSIESLLHPVTFADPTLLSRIGRAVGEGHAVVIPNAFDEAFAESTHAALMASQHWQPYERLTAPFFHFRHHNIYEFAHFPKEVVRSLHAFDSADTKKRMTELTGSDCTGRVIIGSSLYLPGDYSLPHSDAFDARTVAYVWYMTKDWQPEWGGHFVWCPTGAIASPTFNTLVMFRVSSTSLHFVSPVSQLARGRRMAVNGWWQSPTPRAPIVEEEPSPWAFPLAPGTYGGGSRKLEAGRDIVLL